MAAWRVSTFVRVSAGAVEDLKNYALKEKASNKRKKRNRMDKNNADGIYSMKDSELRHCHYNARKLVEKLYRYGVEFPQERDCILRELLGSAGSNLRIKDGFQCDLGFNIHIGDNFLANYNLTILDMAKVTIGNNVWIGPNVGLYAVSHPVDAELRLKMLGIAQPITIGNNVWIGGNSTILMNVTIGDNCVIGAGSVVTKSIPANCIAYGNPCRIAKKLPDTDQEPE